MGQEGLSWALLSKLSRLKVTCVDSDLCRAGFRWSFALEEVAQALQTSVILWLGPLLASSSS